MSEHDPNEAPLKLPAEDNDMECVRVLCARHLAFCFMPVRLCVRFHGTCNMVTQTLSVVELVVAVPA